MSAVASSPKNAAANVETLTPAVEKSRFSKVTEKVMQFAPTVFKALLWTASLVAIGFAAFFFSVTNLPVAGGCLAGGAVAAVAAYVFGKRQAKNPEETGNDQKVKPDVPPTTDPNTTIISA